MLKYRAEKYIEKKEAVSRVREEEAQMQRIETARVREQEKGRRQREYFKSGGASAAFGKGLRNFAVNVEKATRPTKGGKKRSQGVGLFDISKIPKIPI